MKKKKKLKTYEQKIKELKKKMNEKKVNQT